MLKSTVLTKVHELITAVVADVLIINKIEVCFQKGVLIHIENWSSIVSNSGVAESFHVYCCGLYHHGFGLGHEAHHGHHVRCATILDCGVLLGCDHLQVELLHLVVMSEWCVPNHD